MRKLYLIVRSNVRKAKGQTAAIIVLILLAAMLLNLWLMLSMDYQANFNRCHDKLNAEHVTLTVDDNDGIAKEYLSEKLKNEQLVCIYRKTNSLNPLRRQKRNYRGQQFYKRRFFANDL